MCQILMANLWRDHDSVVRSTTLMRFIIVFCFKKIHIKIKTLNENKLK